MKTTVVIADDLARRLKLRSKQTGKPMRALIEDGLRLVLQAPPVDEWRLPDRSVGSGEAPDPLVTLSWQDLRGLIYGQS